MSDRSRRSAGSIRAFAAAASLLALSLPAAAQVASSGPLGDLTPWGVGWIGARDGAFTASLWSNTDGPTLESLLKEVAVNDATAGERMLLGAIVKSSGKSPAGDSDGALAERARLLRELGEEADLIDLYNRFPGAPWSRSGAALEVDQDLAAGYAQKACARVQAETDADADWLRARAACNALAGNFEAAALSAEMATSAGSSDAWLLAAIDALADPKAKNKPDARFDDGVSTALSLAGEFAPKAKALDSIPPNRAALIFRRDDAPPLLRIQAAMRAARAGALDAGDERRAMIPAAPDQTSAGAAPAGLETPMQAAVSAVKDPALSLEQKALALVGALNAPGGDAVSYAMTARILTPERNSMPQRRETARMAGDFARAALAAGDIGQARQWRDAMDNDFSNRPAQAAAAAPEPAPTPSAGPTVLGQQAQETSPPPAAMLGLPPIIHPDWNKARIDILLAIAGDARAKAASLRAASVLANDTEHMNGAIRLLRAAEGAGLALPPDARAVLNAAFRDKPPKSSAPALLVAQMESSAQAGASGEAAILALTALQAERKGQKDDVSLSRALRQLRALGQDGPARLIALEAADLHTAW